MTIYIVYLVLVGVQSLFFYRGGKLRKENFNMKGYLTLCCIELILLAGVRGYTVGADTSAYLAAIDYYGRMSVSEIIRAELVYPFDFEIGFFWLVKLSCMLRLGKTTFLFIVASIIYIPIFRLIQRYSSNAYISILCYFAFNFFTYSLGLFRQMIASSIIICGLNYVVERKFFKYFAIVLLAMTFHTTAFVGFLLYFLYRLKWQRIFMWFIPIELSLLIFGRYVIEFITRVFPQYESYIGGEYDTQGGTYLMLIVLNLVFIANLIFQKRKNEKSEKETQNENIVLCSLLLAIFLQCPAYSMGIFGRIVSYFSIFLIIAIPNLINNMCKNTADEGFNRRQRVIVSFVIIIGLFALTIRAFSGNQYVVPYYAFWK